MQACRRLLMVFRRFLVITALVLAGCSTTGSTFDASALDMLTPGRTTLAQASALLQSDPVDVYPRGDGSVLARWAHKASFVPDAVYFNRELWLQFDQYGYFERVVKSSNVPQAGRAGRASPDNRTMPAPDKAPDTAPGHAVPIQTIGPAVTLPVH